MRETNSDEEVTKKYKKPIESKIPIGISNEE